MDAQDHMNRDNIHRSTIVLMRGCHSPTLCTLCEPGQNMYMCKFKNQGPNVVGLQHITLALFCVVDTGGSSIPKSNLRDLSDLYNFWNGTE